MKTTTAICLILLFASLPAHKQANAKTQPKRAPDMRAMKYGFFVHYVPAVTVDSSGKTVMDPDAIADAFDAEGFSRDLQAMGVEYIIFTAWHFKMVTLYPSKKMPKWIPTGHTTKRDLIGDMLKACKAKGIPVFLYTHPRDGHDFLPAEQDLTGWGSGAEGVDPNWKTFNFARWNEFINDMYGELVERYGNDIAGVYLDEGNGAGNSYKVVDYQRLRQTIKAGHPHLLMIQNYFGNLYTCDIGDVEYARLGTFSSHNGEEWAANRHPVAPIVGSSWVASQGRGTKTVHVTPEAIFRYTVLQAGTNTDGLGVQWASGPYPGGGWEDGVLETMTKAGQYITKIARSIKNTYPSTSYVTPEGRSIMYLDWGVATKSTDDRHEYIHVLKPPVGKTLKLPPPADGKHFGSAKLVANEHPVTLKQDKNGVTLSVGEGDAWDPLDTAIELSVTGRNDRQP